MSGLQFRLVCALEASAKGKRAAVVVGPTQRKDRWTFGMIDLHTHTLLSDGELIPTELARRFEVLGYRAIAFTDHVDTALVETIVPAGIPATSITALLSGGRIHSPRPPIATPNT